MPDEVTEPKNIREAIAMRQAEGIPEIVSEPDPVVAPVETDPVDEFVAEHQEPVVEPDPTTAPAASDPYAEFGGEQAVRDSLTLTNAMKSEQGARVVTAQLLQALGYSPDQIQSALRKDGATATEATAATAQAATAPAATDPLAGLADDDVVTAADVRALLAATATSTAEEVRRELAAATQPLADQLQADRSRIATQTTDSTLVELLGAPPADPKELADWQAEAQGILAQAAIGFDQSQWDPAYIRQSLIRGHAAHEAEAQRRLTAYARRKAADKAKVPTHVGAAQQTGGTDAPEPKNIKEAIALRKAAGIQ